MSGCDPGTLYKPGMTADQLRELLAQCPSYGSRILVYPFPVTTFTGESRPPLMRVSFAVSEQMYYALKGLSEMTGRTLQDLLLDAIYFYLYPEYTEQNQLRVMTPVKPITPLYGDETKFPVNLTFTISTAYYDALRYYAYTLGLKNVAQLLRIILTYYLREVPTKRAKVEKGPSLYKEEFEFLDEWDQP